MTALNRPEITDVYSMLRNYNGLIVHFSAAYNLSGKDITNGNNFYPNDLKYIISGGAQGGISTSIVTPEDDIGFNVINSKAVGSVGIIVGLKYSNSIVEVDAKDCGSILDESGIRYVDNPRSDITVTDLKRTIDTRVNYNEWIVRDFNVLGILALSPYEIKVQCKIPDPTAANGITVTNDIARTMPPEIMRELGVYKVYSYINKDIYQFDEANYKLNPIEHSKIYTLE